jgi:glycosyltransferase involved in cell wall biosynthesis
MATSPDPTAHDFVCVNGKDWALLPGEMGTTRVIHFVQHAGYAADPLLRSYLQRPARRTFTSRALHDRLAPLANGPTAIVPIGIDESRGGEIGSGPRPRRVTLFGVKQPDFAAALAARLEAIGLEPLLIGAAWRPHEEYLRMMRESEILVTLPLREEGFFLPALEGMACGCAVVCSDAVGNRGHCVADETCLQPDHGDLDGHVAAVEQLVGNDALKARLRAGGMAMARRHSMAGERAAFHAMLDAALADQEARSLCA